MSAMASESAQMGVTVAGVMANILKKGLEQSFITEDCALCYNS